MTTKKTLFILLMLIYLKAIGCMNLEIGKIQYAQVLPDDNDQDTNILNNNINKNKKDVIIGIETKRPKDSNIEDYSQRDYISSTVQYGNEVFIYTGNRRFKREPKKPESMANIRKKLNADKQKKEEPMAADAHPAKDMNFTGPRGLVDPQYPHFGGIKTEQNHNPQLGTLSILKKERMKELDNDMSYKFPGTECDFEKSCSWNWKRDSNNGFRVISSQEYGANETGPPFDATGATSRNFLLLRLTPTTNETHLTSPLFNPSDEACKIELWIYQESMFGANMRLVVDTLNHSIIVVDQIGGDDGRRWRRHEMVIGKQPQSFTIVLEVVPSKTLLKGATVAFDNIKLLQCFPETISANYCTPHQYQCNSSNFCVNSSQVCDITEDCEYGDDERYNCDKIPYGARCNFEEDWCGWYSDMTKTLRWTRDDGNTNRTDQIVDHTYKNTSGRYLHVNAPDNKDASFASIGTLNSIVFNPPPRVHGNSSSRYYNSCTIRFYLHQSGQHKSGFMLLVTEFGPKENITHELLWSYSSYKDNWVRQVAVLPNITNKYYIRFDVRKGIRYVHAIAIDDFSLSPECFGLNIPPIELNGYNYWNPYEHPSASEPHKDFVNKTYYEITPCGRKGRLGPTVHNCSRTYNNTNTSIEVMTEKEMRGIQKWKVPKEGFYTFILAGASGGKGSSGMGSSRGAMVRTVLELGKGQEIYILVGQEGSDACIKSLDNQGKSSCRSVASQNPNVTRIQAVYQLKVKDGGGGGGGATYVFLYNKEKKSKMALAVAAGGGGLGLGRFIDSGLQHGQAINTSRTPITGQSYGRSAGAGGGWKKSSGRSALDLENANKTGLSLLEGGLGGKACYTSNDGQGDGGFGGGGGGCVAGGGGGGYAGGYAYSENTTNGEGGYSYLDPRYIIPNLSEARSGYHAGPGYVLIIPAIRSCGCDYQCVALDERRSQVICICPRNWRLHEDGKQCILIEGGETYPSWFVAVLIAFIICLTAAFSVMCFMLYNRYQQRASELLRRKMMSGADLPLSRLRVASDSMMTEYNPNYEFGGVVYTLKDLKDIPRDQLRLVKALGQGAFGEVYQGFYRQRTGDLVEMPVAVKTLPEMSTNQAELDFLMEALIMSKFCHPNIVHFIGVCFDKHPRFIVLELLAGGDLKNFLRESRPKPERPSHLTMKDLVMISQDVAKGCRYLETNRFIHRDIAARNCLLTSKGPGRVVKIADFGMSRDIYRSDYYRKGGKAMLPIKWMPPEAFLDGIFTSKTDVWSFGVLLWEIMSLGYMPYTGCANREVMQLVTSGGRLEPPANCPGPIYAIMTRCWHPMPENRPDFQLILERLDYCSQDPEVMNAPLPVFNRPPSHERDVTVMRPHNSDDHCLQVPQSTDYLIPNHNMSMAQNTVGSTSSVDKLLPDNSDSWETSFVMSHSRSTQPLLTDPDHSTEETTGSNEKLLDLESNEVLPSKISPISLPNNINSNHNNNVKNDLTTLKSGVSLDASALVKQAMKYANVNTGESVTGNGIIQNGPYSNQNNYMNNANSKKILSESEISC